MQFGLDRKVTNVPLMKQTGMFASQLKLEIDGRIQAFLSYFDSHNEHYIFQQS